MKVLFLTIFVFSLFSASAFSQESGAREMSAPSSKTRKLQEALGKIDSVTLSSVDSGTKSAFVIIKKNGERMIFVVKTGIGIPVSGTDDIITLNELLQGDRVSVTYLVTKEGLNRAMTIEVDGVSRRQLKQTDY